jgi:ribosomal protein S14
MRPMQRGGRSSVLKKRTKKLLNPCARTGRNAGLMDKSFLLLFFKKEVLA